MARPEVHEMTTYMYDRMLPAFMRDDDELEDYNLLRFLDLIGAEFGEVWDMMIRIRDELADPALADYEWLPWLAQLVGIYVPRAGLEGLGGTYAALSIDFATYDDLSAEFADYDEMSAYVQDLGVTVDLRTIIAEAASGWRVGSRGAYRKLIEPYLSGSKTIVFVPNYEGDPWHLVIYTYADESPVPGVIQAVIDLANIRAAGLVVEHLTYPGATYDELGAEFATYDDLDTGIDDYDAQHTYIPGGP